MEEPDKRKQINQKFSKLQAFPVPFSLSEIKENISINSNTKTSQEQILKTAFKLHSEGNFSEAAKYYQHFINQNFTDHRVFSNYGIVLKNLGKLKEAASLYRKAIQLKPHFAEAHLNLGNILRDLGKLKEAEL